MDQRRSNPEATMSVIRQVIGSLQKKESGLQQAYAMLNVVLGINSAEARPLIEPTREESMPVVSSGERVALFIDWQLNDARPKSEDWRKALETVHRVLKRRPLDPELLAGEGSPPPDELAFMNAQR